MGHPTSPPSHSAGSRLTASSVQARTSLSYTAPRLRILAHSPRSHGCSQASSTQPEFPSPQWPIPTRGAPLPAYTAPAPSGICLPSPPPGSQAPSTLVLTRRFPLPTSSVVPTWEQLPCGSPKPILHLIHCSRNSPFPLRGTGCTPRTPFCILLSDPFTNCTAAISLSEKTFLRLRNPSLLWG